eukprot:3374559-Amphidinium_carterae.1
MQKANKKKREEEERQQAEKRKTRTRSSRTERSRDEYGESKAYDSTYGTTIISGSIYRTTDVYETSSYTERITTRHRRFSTDEEDADDTIKTSTQSEITTRQPQLPCEAQQEIRPLLREATTTGDATTELHKVPSYERLQYGYTRDKTGI